MFKLEVVFLLLFVFLPYKGKCSSRLCPSFELNCVDNNDMSADEDYMPTPVEELIKLMGYPVEIHEIITEDGYILTYHRIPHGKVMSNCVPKRPVLLQHGLLASSAVWVLSTNALAYNLADAGFDVWLGNSRGNTCSRKHVKLDPVKDKRKFWDFSWHEMGYYDLPASIDYILCKTKNSQLFYIGHSMGTTMFFVLGSTRPEYMDKIHAAVIMAPVALLQNIKSTVVKDLIQISPILNWLHRVFGIYYLMVYSYEDYWLEEHVCANSHLQFICRDVLFSLTGYDKEELSNTLLPVIYQYVPAGTSFKELEHFRQISQNGFEQFDYGYVGNLIHYRTIHPPAYNLSNVKAPLYVYYSSNDWLAVPQDVSSLITLLPNVQKVTKVPYDNFNHVDFMWATDAKQLLFNDVIKTLNSLS